MDAWAVTSFKHAYIYAYSLFYERNKVFKFQLFDLPYLSSGLNLFILAKTFLKLKFPITFYHDFSITILRNYSSISNGSKHSPNGNSFKKKKAKFKVRCLKILIFGQKIKWLEIVK